MARTGKIITVLRLMMGGCMMKTARLKLPPRFLACHILSV